MIGSEKTYHGDKTHFHFICDYYKTVYVCSIIIILHLILFSLNILRRSYVCFEKSATVKPH